MKMKEIYTTNLSQFRIRTAMVLTRLLAITLLVVMAGFANQLLAQVSVTATAGTVGPTPYLTLKEAFDAINLGTHQGIITVGISANTAETAPAVLNSSGAGSAVYTSVLVQPTVDGVTVSGATVAGRGLIELNGADNVTIDGDNPNSGGTNRNLTLTNTAGPTIGLTSVIRIAVIAAVPSADNNTFRNLNINGSAVGRNAAANTSTTGSENNTFGIYAGGLATGAITAPGPLTSVTTNTAAATTTINALNVTNNAINACARAIVFNGATAAVSTSVTIANNVIGGSGTLVGAPPYTSPATTVYTKGIYIVGTTAVSITGNTLQNILSYVGTAMNAIELNTAIGAGGVNISNNTITGVVNNGTSSAANGIVLTSSSSNPTVNGNIVSNVQTLAGATVAGIILNHTGTAGTAQNNKVSTVYSRGSGGFGSYGINLNAGNAWTIQNNMVWDINSFLNNSGTLNTQFGPFGIRVAAGLNHRIYHNSVNMSGAFVGGSSASSCAAFVITATTLTGIEVKNNIFANTMTGAPAGTSVAAIMLPSGGTSAMNLVINNNDYYAPATIIGQVGTAAVSTFTAAAFDPSTTAGANNLRNYTSTLLVANTNNDNASMVVSPPFTSSTDLHIPNGTFTNLESAGMVVSTTIDIDGETRSLTAPDMGADEFAGTSCVGVTPTVAVLPTSTNYCSGSTPIALTASGATTYTWSPTMGLSATTGTSVNASPLATTTYTVTGDGCTGSATVTVTVLQSPTISATADPVTVACNGMSQLQAVVPNTALPNTYAFAGSTGAYASVAGTAVTFGSMDDGFTGNLPIGFSFSYNGISQTVFAVSPNGHIELGQTGSSTTFIANVLATNANMLAPLWDDNNITGGSVQYITSGVVGSRILTVQWTDLHVGGSGSNVQPTISMQALLYEATGQIQFIYGSTSTALTSTTASIGISGNVGNFLSVTPLSPANTSTVSSVTENLTIASATNFPSGTIYTFTPPPATYSWSPATFLSATNIANPVASNVTATTVYTVTTTAANTCTASATATVTVSPACPVCPTPPMVLDGNSAVCTGGNIFAYGDWQGNREAAVAAAGGTNVVNTIEYSGDITGVTSGCASANQVVTASMRCDNGTPGNTADDVVTLIGTYTLTVYPAILTPTPVIGGCGVTITGVCANDLVTFSNPSVTGSYNSTNGTHSATFTADPGQPAGTIDYTITSGVPNSTCSATGSTETPACAAAIVCPTAPTASNQTGVSCSGGALPASYAIWRSGLVTAVFNAGGTGVTNTAEFVPDITISTTNTTCASVNQVVTASMRCDNGTPGNTGDDIVTPIGTYTLTVNPAVQTPTPVTNGCSVTITGVCANDLVTFSNPSVTGSYNTTNGTHSATFTADPGQPAGTIDYTITSGVPNSTCSATGTINTPACAANTCTTYASAANLNLGIPDNTPQASTLPSMWPPQVVLPS